MPRHGWFARGEGSRWEGVHFTPPADVGQVIHFQKGNKEVSELKDMSRVEGCPLRRLQTLISRSAIVQTVAQHAQAVAGATTTSSDCGRSLHLQLGPSQLQLLLFSRNPRTF